MWIRFFQSTVTYPGRGSWSSTRHHWGAFAVMDGLMDRIVYRSNGFRCFGIYVYRLYRYYINDIRHKKLCNIYHISFICGDLKWPDPWLLTVTFSKHTMSKYTLHSKVDSSYVVLQFLCACFLCQLYTWSTISTLLHEKVNPKDWEYSLGDAGVLQFFRVVSSDYGRSRYNIGLHLFFLSTFQVL